MSHHIIELNDVCYTYPDGTRALDGVTLRITHGESVGIVGANGAGKTTLLLHLNGCLTPTGGLVRIGDFPLNDKTLQDVRRSVGMIFQNVDDQLFMPRVNEDVAFGPLNLGLSADETDARVDSALETVGSLHLKRRATYRLSDGEKRAVSIAGVLAMSPNILVMDEPSSGLDPRARRQLIELLRTFKHTKIIAAHDLDLIWELCERTIVISGGKVTADGATREIFRDSGLLEANHLEPPLRLQA